MIRRSTGRLGRPSLIGVRSAGVDSSDRLIEQLTQLAALKDRGVLTEEEFAMQKALLLNSP